MRDVAQSLTRRLSVKRILGLMSGAFWLAASASSAVAQSAATPVAQRFIAPPAGTSVVFQRSSSGSYGAGQGQVRWDYLAGQWQGQPVIEARVSLGGGTLHDPATFGMIANLNAAGEPTMTYAPPVAVPWPLSVGKAVTTEHTVTLQPSGQQVRYTADWRVEAYETIQVPAGSFAVYRVVRQGSDGEVETRWVSGDQPLPLIKRQLERLPSHRMGAGVQEAELAEYKLPGR